MRLSHSLLLTSIALSALAGACATASRRSNNDDDEDETSGNGSPSSSGNSVGGSGGSTAEGGAGGTTTTTTTTTATTTTGGIMCAHSNLTFNDPTCGACVEDECCPSLQACDGSTLCLDLIDCMSTCTDQPCVDACAEANPTGASQLTTLDTCITGNCDLECPTN